VLDLIAGLLKPQDISQPLSPTIVPDTSTGPQGTNPMAIVILAIAVIAGIFWFAHRKKRAA
jgi:LPXTG-motif cell wall-anchored protein